MYLRRNTVSLSSGARVVYLSVAHNLWVGSVATPFVIVTLGREEKADSKAAQRLVKLLDEVLSEVVDRRARNGSFWRLVWYRYLRLVCGAHQKEIKSWVSLGKGRKRIVRARIEEFVSEAEQKRALAVQKSLTMLHGWDMTAEALGEELELPADLMELTLEWLQEQGAPIEVHEYPDGNYWSWVGEAKPKKRDCDRWAEPQA